MSKDMKSIMENWRKQALNEGAIQMITQVWKKVTDPEGAKAAAKETEKIAQTNRLQTVGELVDLIKVFKSKEKALAGAKKLDDLLSIGFLDGLASTMGNVGFELLTWMADIYVFKKQKKPQDTLKYFKVDPNIAAIVDNDVEEAFLQWFIKQGIEDSGFRSKKLSEFNMNSTLRDFIAKVYKSRTITGPDKIF